MAAVTLDDLRLLLDHGKVDAAFPHLARMVVDMPAYLPAWVLLARAFEQRSQWPEAQKIWAQMAFMAPEAPVVRDGLRETRRKMRMAAGSASRQSAPPVASVEPAAPVAPPPRMVAPEPVAPVAPPPRAVAPEPVAPVVPPPRMVAPEPVAPVAPPPPRMVAPEPVAPVAPPPRAVAPEPVAPPPPRMVAPEPVVPVAPPPRAVAPEPVAPVAPPPRRPAPELFSAPQDEVEPAPRPVEPRSFSSLFGGGLRPAAPVEEAPQAAIPPRRAAPEEQEDPFQAPLQWNRPAPVTAVPPASLRPPAAPEPSAKQNNGLLDLDNLDDLIDALTSKPRIEPRKDLDAIPPPDLDSPVDNVASETLARILAMQKQYAQAADMYARLAQQQPERAAHFRAEAEKLRALIA